MASRVSNDLQYPVYIILFFVFFCVFFLTKYSIFVLSFQNVGVNKLRPKVFNTNLSPPNEQW